jgi:hypothetical protein
VLNCLAHSNFFHPGGEKQKKKNKNAEKQNMKNNSLSCAIASRRGSQDKVTAMGPPTGGGGKQVAAAGGGPSKGGVGKNKAAAGTPKGTSNDGLAKQATLTSWLRPPGARPGRGVYQGR